MGECIYFGEGIIEGWGGVGGVLVVVFWYIVVFFLEMYDILK